MVETFRQAWQYLWFRVAGYTLAVAMTYSILRWFTHGAKEALTTVLIAFIFSYLTSPVVRWFEHRKLHRALGVLTVFLGLFIFLGVATVMLGNILGELTRFTSEIPKFVEPFSQWVQSLPDQIGKIQVAPPVKDALTKATENLQTILQGFTDTLLKFLQSILGKSGDVISVITKLFGGFFQFLTAMTISIYLMYDLPKITNSLFHAVPTRLQPFVSEISQKGDKAFGNFVRGQTLVAVAVGLIVSLSMYLAYGFSFQDFGTGTLTKALSIGFLSFMFNFIPFVGVIISSIPAILLSLPAGWTGIIAVLIGLWFSNQLEGNLVAPFIMRKATHIHPVTGISAILIFSSLFGFVGALMSGPVTAFLKVLYTDYYLHPKMPKVLDPTEDKVFPTELPES